jgi:hypothetical protein
MRAVLCLDDVRTYVRVRVRVLECGAGPVISFAFSACTFLQLVLIMEMEGIRNTH